MTGIGGTRLDSGGQGPYEEEVSKLWEECQRQDLGGDALKDEEGPGTRREGWKKTLGTGRGPAQGT